ncbi:MAG: serine/threonine-protein kinase [Woeseiaceae bacterium]|nr:serine/threonine-protein kinase [Woeseiaceae bacterium]
MNIARRKRIDEIFTGALDRSGDERSRFVNEQCGDDDELRSEVEALLAAASDKDVDAQIEGARDRMVQSIFEDDPDAGEDLSDKVFQNWRLEKRIARGGLATVYLAHRDDGEFEQKAAFKVLRRGLDTDDLIARFRAERQILSSLAHPSIAQILDGGALDDGRPYLVLEFVSGMSITEYCEQQRLDVRGRVVLMIEVLRALHHAHTRLVVHRDVKPSNILVTDDGNVSLLDFGIAKLLDPESMPGSSTMTRTGVSLMTPGYGSPEQHAGATVTTASDVYQCGLVLYEMLTGDSPYVSVTEARASADLVPSTKLKGRPEFKDVRGDLDAIVRKATRGDPDIRYASADEMVSDLQRYLDGLPVLAQPDSFVYRAKKLARRRPLLFPVAALVIAGLAAYVATITMYSQRLEREERLAAASQQFLVDLFKSPDPYAPADADRGSGITVVEALDIGRNRIEDELGDQPELKATLLRAVSEVYDSLGQSSDAVATREEALALERDLYGEQSDAVIHSLQSLGGMYRTLGDQEKADEYLNRQLELARGLYEATAPELGLAETLAGSHAQRSGRIEEGRALLAAGVDKLRSERVLYAENIISALIESVQQHGLESQDEAYAALAEAEELALEVFGESSIYLANVRIRMASTMTRFGDYDEAEQNFLIALPVLEERFGTDHSVTMVALNNLGFLYNNSGETAKAEDIYRELLERWIRIHGENSRAVADTYQNLASAVSMLGRYEEALPLHRRAYEIYRHVLNDDNYMIAFPLLSMANASLQIDDAATAEAASREALERFQATVPGTFLEGVAQCLVGLSLEAKGDVDTGTQIVLDSHELILLGRVPDPYPTLCRLSEG